jgi:hypothetical protein
MRTKIIQFAIFRREENPDDQDSHRFLSDKSDSVTQAAKAHFKIIKSIAPFEKIHTAPVEASPVLSPVFLSPLVFIKIPESDITEIQKRKIQLLHLNIL